MRSAITLSLIFLLLCAAQLSIAFAQERSRRVEVIPPKGSASPVQRAGEFEAKSER